MFYSFNKHTIVIQYKQGDLIEAFKNKDIHIMAHCENCEGLDYFKGIAKVIHKEYPELTKVHQKTCNRREMPFGKIANIEVDEDQYIYNLYGQVYRGKPSDRVVYVNDIKRKDNLESRLEAIESSLKLMKLNIHNTYEKEDLSNVKIGIPLLMSGLASEPLMKVGKSDLNYFKKYIFHIVEESLEGLDVTVYHL